ncbi:hypothetical protein OG984_05090 [Nocardioides sp. NBC_00368]|uniref:hypothetical protein n=1 Tax=Nocardioides TaxID=1839 RepID=UPI0002029260|nr:MULTISPECIES: hypothetical protein [Nocardioides]EGD42547.1 hypothetical protein NBCG_03135 [Nocardioidaceae bacterium Broad-1]MBG6096419.1 hypothetical protein [Nocardioides luteus]
MNSAVIAVTIGMIVFWTVLMLIAAFLDRRRGRQIEHDLTEMEREYHLDGRDRYGSFDHRPRSHR